MTRNEIAELIKDSIIDMKELKGYDMASRTSSYLGFKYTWRIEIQYDKSDKVISADANTANELCGYLDRRWNIGG